MKYNYNVYDNKDGYDVDEVIKLKKKLFQNGDDINRILFD